MKNRIISLVLALALIFCLASCQGDEEIPPKDTYLTVESEPVEYTEEGIDTLSTRVADIFARLAPYLGYPAISDAKKSEIAEYFRTDIIPVLQEILIYQDELFELADSAEECLMDLEEQNKDDVDLGFAINIYTEFSAVLDAERTGAFIYRLGLISLSNKRDAAKKNYDKYGTGYDKIAYYDSLIEDVNTLGGERFSEAFSAIMFMLSSVIGLSDSNGGSFKVTPADVLVVMEKQGEMLAGISLTDSEWQTVAAMCEEHIPTGTRNDLQGKMLMSLNNDNFFITAATLMPDVIAFYSAVATDVSEDTADIIESDDPMAYELAVYTELLKHEGEFRALLTKLSEELPGVGKFMQSGINAYDKAGYAAFCERPVATADDLMLAIETFTANPTEDALSAVNDSAGAFLAGINSVIAYVYFYI